MQQNLFIKPRKEIKYLNHTRNEGNCNGFCEGSLDRVEEEFNEGSSDGLRDGFNEGLLDVARVGLSDGAWLGSKEGSLEGKTLGFGEGNKDTDGLAVLVGLEEGQGDADG